jgi:pilus assembly protein CpaB
MKQQRTLIVLTVAVITALIAAYGVFQALQRVPVREVEVASVPVVVASEPIPVGTMLTRDHLRVVAWPARNQVPGAFSTPDQVVNRGVIATIGENEPITPRNVADPASGAGLPPVIPPGMRAISVRVNEVIGVAGFVVPGTRVDLVVTVDDEGGAGGGRGEAMSRIVLSNLLVLTSGTRYDQQEAREGQAQRATVVTLAVLPEDAERIALAQSEGQISLALRNPLDADPTKTQGVRFAALMRGDAPVPVVNPQTRRVIPRPVVQAPPPPPVYRVETIRAAKRAEEVVGK